MLSLEGPGCRKAVWAVLSIGVWLVSTVPVRASTAPMVVWAGGSDLVCVAVPVLCSLVAVVVAYMDALAP